MAFQVDAGESGMCGECGAKGREHRGDVAVGSKVEIPVSAIETFLWRVGGYGAQHDHTVIGYTCAALTSSAIGIPVRAPTCLTDSDAAVTASALALRAASRRKATLRAHR